MSYQRSKRDRLKVLKATYGTTGDEAAPRTYHRETPIRSHVEADRKIQARKGYRKHKGAEYDR